DGRRLYVAETWTGRVWSWELAGPGEVVAGAGFGPAGGTLLAGLPGFQLFDSLAVDGAGNVCVATLVTGAITVISPGGEVIEQVPTGDPLTTNICFGGRELRTAYVTASGTGRLLATEWPRPGLRLEYPSRGSPSRSSAWPSRPRWGLHRTRPRRSTVRPAPGRTARGSSPGPR